MNLLPFVGNDPTDLTLGMYGFVALIFLIALGVVLAEAARSWGKYLK